ncbi:MAG: SCO family protein [Caulobacteraceae bacterium]|nr:SCO family protein [Caulobacteraceae bacterium]
MARRWFLAGVVAVMIALGGAAALFWPMGAGGGGGGVGGRSVGGPFSLADQDGRPVTEQTLKGKPTAIVFGFTYCPEICPTTLTNMTAWLKALGPDADRLNMVFVSVDPERDTPAQLKSYLSAFDPRIRGLTGSPEAVARIAGEYQVYYRKVPIAGGGYTMDHSSAIYLMDAKGRFVAPIAFGTPFDSALASLRRLIHP